MRGNLFTAAYPHFLLCLVQESKDFLMRMLWQMEEHGGKKFIIQHDRQATGCKKNRASWRMTMLQ